MSLILVSGLFLCGCLSIRFSHALQNAHFVRCFQFLAENVLVVVIIFFFCSVRLWITTSLEERLTTCLGISCKTWTSMSVFNCSFHWPGSGGWCVIWSSVFSECYARRLPLTFNFGEPSSLSFFFSFVVTCVSQSSKSYLKKMIVLWRDNDWLLLLINHWLILMLSSRLNLCWCCLKFHICNVWM